MKSRMQYLGTEETTFAIGEDNYPGRKIIIRHPKRGRMEATATDGVTILAYAILDPKSHGWTVANARDLRDALFGVDSQENAVQWLKRAAAKHRVSLAAQAEALL